MGEKLTTIGIDVSKKSLDVCIYEGEKKSKLLKFNNEEKGYEKLLNYVEKEVEEGEKIYIMESTGIYHLRLAIYLYKNGSKVVVLNPYVIKKYSEMQMKRSKTDEIDARLISEYGYENKKRLLYFKPNSQEQYEIEQMLKLISNYKDLISKLCNYREGIKHNPYPSSKVLRDIEKQITNLKESIKKLEKEIEKKLKKSFKKEYEQLRSIKGVGAMLSASIISILNNFEEFSNAKKVSAYLGICPGVKESGTSVRGKGRIIKQGNRYIRKILYMCSITAMRYNKSCRELSERLKAKGKKWKEIVIAVANKLIRQAYGILKNGTFYEDDYCCKMLK